MRAPRRSPLAAPQFPAAERMHTGVSPRMTVSVPADASADVDPRPNAYVSAFDLFSVGIGPSSSHTVGPMRAARAFADSLSGLPDVARVACVLHGSLGATGLGHGTPDAVVAGLQGHAPETVDPALVRGAWSEWVDGVALILPDGRAVPFSRADVELSPWTRFPGHPNAMSFRALGSDGDLLTEATVYSIGGGFIRSDGADASDESPRYPRAFATMSDLIELCRSSGRSIAEIARENEEAARDPAAVAAGLDAVWNAMAASIANGMTQRGTLPGSLGVHRRAADIREQLEREAEVSSVEPASEWLGVYALAVNEENAAGGRIVTAPTNGAGGVVPAVAMYWWRFLAGAGSDGGATDGLAVDAHRDGARAAGIRTFLLTATAVGSIIKANASISGAEGGCQAEIGSACAMAAAGLTAVLGGTPAQIENAAEIAVEHHLGLTCDPVAGLVQIPCIERNAIAASTAVAAARLSLRGDGTHRVPLDVAVETMRQTGADMSTKYKETSAGGLAVNVIEC